MFDNVKRIFHVFPARDGEFLYKDLLPAYHNCQERGGGERGRDVESAREKIE
jgi:hypothetical protein